MKATKITYWVSTGLLSAMMLLSGCAHFTSAEVKTTFELIGFPDYFRIELGIFKLLGVAVLLIPAVPQMLKNWAYAGFGITFISAVVANTAAGNTPGIAPAIFAFVLLIVSGISQQKLVKVRI